MAINDTAEPGSGGKAAGQDISLGVKAPASLVAELDAFAKGLGISRSDAVGRALTAMLKTGGPGTTTAGHPFNAAPRGESRADTSGLGVQIGPTVSKPGSRLKSK